MTVYLVAQSTAPAIFCPPWCERTDMHVSELEDWEGRAVHQGWWPTVTDRGPNLAIGRTLLTDGTPENADLTGGALNIHLDGLEFSIEQMEEFAGHLADAIQAAKIERERAR